MAFLPQTFLSNLNSKDGPAKANRFMVVIPIPAYINQFIGHSLLEQIVNFPGTIVSDISNAITGQKTSNAAMSRYLSLQCESSELPGRFLQTMDGKVYGPIFKVPYQSQYQDVSCTFICSNKFYERKLFDRWMEAIHPSDTNNLRFPKGYASTYLTDVKIIQYDDFIRQIYAVELMDAFPIGIASQPVSWGSGDFHKLTIQFAYQRYKTIYDAPYNLSSFAMEVFGADASKWLDQKTGELIAPIGKIFDKIFK